MVDKSRIIKSKLLKILIGASVAFVFVFIFLIEFIISLKLNIQFYNNRLSLDWLKIVTQNYAALLWCPLVTIIILIILVSCLNPTTSGTLTLIYSVLNKGIYRRPSRVKCLIWNYAVIAGIGGLVMGWVIGFLTNAGFGIFVANQAGMDFNFSTFLSAMSYPLNPGIADMNVVFTFSFILRPFILFAVGIIIAKLTIDLIASLALRGAPGANPFKVTGTIALDISLAFFIIWLFLPSAAFDVVDSLAATAVVFGFFASLIVGGIFYGLAILNPERYRGKQFYKKFIAIALIALFAIPVGALIAAGVKGLYRESNWETWVWDTKTSTQIDKTRTAAGLDDFKELTTQQLMNNQSASGTSDEEIIPHIRTYDYEASRSSMENQIGSSWETLADSDIIFINGSEYWCAPRTIKYDDSWSWVQEHLIYTHSRGFLAMNPVTGELMLPGSAEYLTVFGVPDNSSIYFGELPSNGHTMLNRPEEEIEGIRYSGEPDVTLEGFLNWWYISNWGFKTGKSTNYTIKRNIYDRVGGILLPYMIIGDDPYLIFNNGRLYYCLDIILDFPAFSGYIQSDIVRWLGVVLVDTQIGTMQFYSYNETKDNLPYNFLNIYYNMYNWYEMPSWLIPQLKYPEILAEYQLQVDYTYHVTDPNIWRSGVDFFELPSYQEEGIVVDMHYIIYNVGYGAAYVGSSIVEFKGAEVGNLVGFYIIENGKLPDNLGQITFYRNGSSGVTQMLGIQAARSAYQQKDAQFLQLLPNKRYGNYLIYPLARSLYYVIPVYETTGMGIETLKRVALVNVFDSSDIGIGNSTMESYDSLNITTTIPAGVLSLNVIRAPAIATSNTYETPTNNLEILINNGFSDQKFNVSLYIRTESEYFNASFAGQEITPIINDVNRSYFISNFTLLETQYIGIIPQITGRVPSGSPSIPIHYYVELYFTNGTLYDYQRRTIYIYT